MSENQLKYEVETMYFIDIDQAVKCGHKWYVFGIREAKNGFGGPTVSQYCGAGITKDAACADALEGIREHESR